MGTFREASAIPVPNRDSGPFWEACKERRLIVRVCQSCGRGHYPPGPACPWCTSSEVQWAQASGDGTVRTYVVLRHPFLPQLAEEIPYAVLKVVLDDYPDAVMYGRLTGAGWEEARVGLPVAVQFEEIGEGFVLPNWKPR